MALKGKNYLVELESGRILEIIECDVPMDCVIKTHSGNGYWIPSDSYSEKDSDFVGYGQGRYGDKKGYKVWVSNSLGFFPDLEDFKRFCREALLDQVVNIEEDQDGL